MRNIPVSCLFPLSFSIMGSAQATLPDPVVYYAFDDDASDGLTTESMGTGLDLSLVNALLSDDNSLGATLGGSWDSEQTLFADGQGDYADGGDAELFEPSVWTISSWIYADDWTACTGGHCSVVSKGNSDAAPEGYWLVVVNGQPRMSIGDASGQEDSVYATAISNAQWHHVVVTLSTPTLSIYVDGSLSVAEEIDSGLAYGTNPFRVGALYNREYDYHGYLDEVRLYDVPLTSDQVMELYHWYIDADGDGYNGPDDCDAENESINPSTVWYVDYDDDGFGNEDSTIQQCEQPDHYVNQSGDCDNDNASVYPGAEERCDGIDNDCDGEIDEESEQVCGCGVPTLNSRWTIGALFPFPLLIGRLISRRRRSS